MKPTLNEKFIAYLALLSGLSISAVAVYYSVVGLTAIFSAAVLPIIIMGTTLELSKLVATVWLKQNWKIAPLTIKTYMTTAVIVLMLITSMGIFGFLSKAHNDQNLVSGDVVSKIATYDEKIKTERENIDANRKALKQMDEAVDQVMGRSSDEKGAEKAVAIRRAQQKERGRIAQDIADSQKRIATLNEERAPIAAEVRKVEAEVGPIKYIAKFIYGDHGADENSLERAVTWIIILIVIVFDPLAVIMLLAAQMTFGWMRKQEPAEVVKEEIKELVVDEPVLEETHTDEVPSETPSTALGGDITAPEEPVVPNTTESELEKWNKMIEEAEREVAKEKEEVIVRVAEQYHPTEDQFTEVTGDRIKPDLTEVIEPESEESKKKTYMTKDQTGQVQIKNREV